MDEWFSFESDEFWDPLICSSGSHDDPGFLNLDAEQPDEQTEQLFEVMGMDAAGLPPSMSSSLSSRRTVSLDSTDVSSDVDAMFDAGPSFPQAFCNGGVVTLTRDDDIAILQAMVAVISSSSSSSPSPTAAALSRPRPFVTLSQPPEAYRTSAFKKYRRQGGGHGATAGNGQRMIKNVLSMLHKISPSSPTSSDAKPAGNQLYHMMSERRRREKLNGSFHTLRSLLPAGSKKDKTSVLINSTNYLKALEAQIAELEQKNRKLEEAAAAPVPVPVPVPKVEISTAGSSPALGTQDVDLKVAVGGECDVAELVLRILEVIRWMEAISLVSVDAQCAFSPPAFGPAAKACIKLRINGMEWDEAVLREAVSRVLDGAPAAAPAPASIQVKAAV